MRKFSPSVTACPGCGRTNSTFFRQLASDIQNFLELKLPEWKNDYPGAEELKVAVMGCVVNGPGESKAAHVGISLPGSGEIPTAPVFIDGKKEILLKGTDMSAEFIEIIEKYVTDKWGRN